MTSIVLFVIACGALRTGYAYLLALILLFFAGPMLRRKAICCNFLLLRSFWLLLFGGVFYVIFGKSGLGGVQSYILLPLAAYAIGWNITEDAGGAQQIKNRLLVIAFGFAAHAGLNLLINLGHSRYQLVDFWSGQFRAATGSGCLNTLIIAIAVYVIHIEKRKLVKAAYVIAAALCLLYMVTLGTRTQFLILLIVCLCCGGVYAYERRGITGLIWLAAVTALIAAICFATYQLNLLSLRDYIDHSNLIRRYQEKTGLVSSNSERFDMLVQGIRALFQYPLGGRTGTYYYHNMWLDANRVGGIFSSSALLLYSVSTWSSMWRIFRRRDRDPGLRYLLFGIYVAVMVNFMFEPVLEGMLDFYLVFCLINGMVDCLRRQYVSKGEGYDAVAREGIGAAEGICCHL